MTIKKENLITREISEALSNKRLDIVLAETFPEYSRSRLKKWLENNLVSVNKRVINKNKEISFELEAVSLLSSKTAQPVIVELKINFQNL